MYINGIIKNFIVRGEKQMKQNRFQKKDKNNIKKYKEKGSITLYVFMYSFLPASSTFVVLFEITLS